MAKRYWFLEHEVEAPCAACGALLAPASNGSGGRISNIVAITGAPIESEIEPAFAVAWGQIFQEPCTCGVMREYVYPQGVRVFSGDREALVRSRPLTLVENAIAPGTHGDRVLVRMYHLGQGTEYIKYWNPDDAVCSICGDPAAIIYSPDRAEVMRLAKKNERPLEFLLCDACDAAVERRDAAFLAQRLERPRSGKMLPRFASMTASDQATGALKYMRTLERAPIAWQTHDLRVNDATLLEPGSLGVSGSENGIDADCHRFIAEHPAVAITGYQLFRAAFRSRYSYSIPSRAALEAIEAAGADGVVECGAGNGYWAYLLRSRGRVAVDAFDVAPLKVAPNTWYSGESLPWTEVRRGDVDVLRKHKAKALFLCWPPAKSSMALYALQLFKGETIIYAGQQDDSCATPVFFEGLHTQWREIERIVIPTIWRMSDDVRIYQRK